MRYPELLLLTAVAVTLPWQPSRANPCSQDIDRAWTQINAKIQARSAAGRSVSQSTIALLHRQPTQSSVAAAKETLLDVWLPLETAVAALSRAREADRADDRIACKGGPCRSAARDRSVTARRFRQTLMVIGCYFS
jgi:hypothetical protein